MSETLKSDIKQKSEDIDTLQKANEALTKEVDASKDKEIQ